MLNQMWPGAWHDARNVQKVGHRKVGRHGYYVIVDLSGGSGLLVEEFETDEEAPAKADWLAEEVTG